MRKLTILPAMIAIGCLITVASWWFMQISLLPGTNAAAIHEISLWATRVILLLQMLSISLFAPLWLGMSSEHSVAHSTTTILSALFPAWPMLAILWLATGMPATALVKTEAVVLGAGLVIALLARAIQHLTQNTEVNRLLQTSLGLAAATTTWLFRTECLQWIAV